MLTRTLVSLSFIKLLTKSQTNKFQTLWRVEGRKEEFLFAYVQLVERMNIFLHMRAQYTCRYISVIMVKKNSSLSTLSNNAFEVEVKFRNYSYLPQLRKKLNTGKDVKHILIARRNFNRK